jgi:hypothetical protein
MNKFVTSLILSIALLATSGCSLLHPVVVNVPGQVNTFDGTAYLTLVTAKGVIDQAKLDVVNGVFPVNLVSNIKVAINDAVNAYNVADQAYQAYHTAAVAGTATSLQQSTVTVDVNFLSGQINALTAAKAGK